MSDYSADELHCFCPTEPVHLKGAEVGPLKGLRFAVKDLFHVQGFRTTGGCPDWFNSHATEERTAPVVLHLLDAGAELVGKVMTDDLACGMFGENVHYGTPLNPKYPEYVPGGSSSGSASAVAGGAADFALGTDTGGSVRVPATYCGIYGIRPTHGVINLEGCLPMSPYFDTCGWFARSAEMLKRVGDVLLPGYAAAEPGEFVIAGDVLEYVDPLIRETFEAALVKLGFSDLKRMNLFAEGPEQYVKTFWILMSRQLWNTHGVWFEREKPTLAPGLAERLRKASEVTGEDFWAAQQSRLQIQNYLSGVLAENRVVLMPTTVSFPPLLNRPLAELDAYRLRAVAQTGIASVGGLPQVAIPGLEAEGLPVGFSLLGGPGQDRMLLELAKSVGAQLAAS